MHPLFYDEATARAVNGPNAGKLVKLGLTDPDSNEVVPWVAPRFRGDFMLDSRGDQELIFDHVTGWWHQSLSVLRLSGWFRVGAMYSAVTPCDQNDAPATCPGPGFPPNYLASDNLATGALTTVPVAGPALHPKGMIFVPFA